MAARLTGFLCLALVAASLPATAQWSVLDTQTLLLPDEASGAPTVVFTVRVAPDVVPPDGFLKGTWTVSALAGSAETALVESTFQSPAAAPAGLVVTTSPPVPVEPGVGYRGRLALTDGADGLLIEVAVELAAADAVPFVLSLAGWDGAEPFDLQSVPDEELEQMAILYDALSSRYDVIERDVDVTEFLRSFRTDDATTCGAVVIAPTAALTLQNPARGGWTLSIHQTLLAYWLGDTSWTAGVRAQLEQLAVSFTGQVYAGGSNLGWTRADLVFVEETTRRLLAAAAAEVEQRTQ